MTGLNVEEAADLLKELKQAAKRQAAEKPAQASKKRKVACPLKQKDEYTQSDLVACLPKNVSGCTVMIEHKWHHRVRGYYPRQTPPYSMSMLRSQVHHARGGSTCPEVDMDPAYREHGSAVRVELALKSTLGAISHPNFRIPSPPPTTLKQKKNQNNVKSESSWKCQSIEKKLSTLALLARFYRHTCNQ
eukprot:3548359-Amphidinium_carterae.1